MDHLKRFFDAQVRQAFGQLGIADKPILDHVTNVLATFARADQLYRMRTVQGGHVDSIVAMLSELGPPEGSRSRVQRERDTRQYIGDYALFMSGIFRTYVERGGFLQYYLSEGSRSYRTVSELDLALYRTGFFVFKELSDRFELYSGALDYLRKSRFMPGPQEDSFADFLRQVDGWIRVGMSEN